MSSLLELKKNSLFSITSINFNKNSMKIIRQDEKVNREKDKNRDLLDIYC